MMLLDPIKYFNDVSEELLDDLGQTQNICALAHEGDENYTALMLHTLDRQSKILTNKLRHLRKELDFVMSSDIPMENKTEAQKNYWESESNVTTQKRAIKFVKSEIAPNIENNEESDDSDESEPI